jgi:hypothetical protein
MNSKHTATPWRLNNNVDIYAEDKENRTLMLGAIINKNNASFIVKACNSHEALVEALKEAQRYILNLKGKEFNVKNSNYFHISVVMNEAIKQAEES